MIYKYFKQSETKFFFFKSGHRRCILGNFQLKLCVRQNCPINGGWSNWSEWGSCSKTCGTALKNITRLCNNPVPEHGGSPCMGDSFKERECATNPCQGTKNDFLIILLAKKNYVKICRPIVIMIKFIKKKKLNS